MFALSRLFYFAQAIHPSVHDIAIYQFLESNET